VKNATATYGLTALTPAYASRLTGTKRTAPALRAGPPATATAPAAPRAYTPPPGLALGAYAYAVTVGAGSYTVTAPNGTRFTGLTATAVTALLRAVSARTA